MTAIRSIIFEGIDRLGKSTLIDGIQNKLGFMQEVHYQKPKLLDIYLRKARQDLMLADDDLSDKVKSYAYNLYQRASFTQMLHMLSSRQNNFIMNRAHLGETVYAPRYRGYNGDYIFDLEDHFIGHHGSDFVETTLLILLHTTSFDFVKDDGQSFDFDKKDEEQNDFIRAFERSKIKHKLMLDVNDGGKFVEASQLISTIIQAYNELPGLNHPILNVSWKDGVKSMQNQPDPNKGIAAIPDESPTIGHSDT